MKNLYLFSGLGADARVFKKLDLSEYNVNFIEWIAPDKNETIEAYAKRLLPQIKSEQPILVGVSFGGIVAIEISKYIEYEKIIIISSIKNRDEIPSYFKFAGKLGLYRLMPFKSLKKPGTINNWLFGVKDIEDRKLLADILRDTDEGLLKWAINQIVSWKHSSIRERLFHIHGSSDKIFPVGFVKSVVLIPDGEHLMILNRAEELTERLRAII